MAKILLVEDDNNLREIYEARLQAEGYTITSAKDGEEALVVAKKERPDLIISDVMMPRISGFEMLDILRNTEGFKDTKVIMLTALGQAEDQARADKLGADRYLVKSQVTLEDIVKAADELLGGGATQTPTMPVTTQPASTAPAAVVPVAVAPAPAPAVPMPTPIVPVAPAPIQEPVTPPPAPTASIPVTPAPTESTAAPTPAQAPIDTSLTVPVPSPSTTPATPTQPADATPTSVTPAPASSPDDQLMANAMHDLLGGAETATVPSATEILSPKPTPEPSAPLISTPVPTPPVTEPTIPAPAPAVPMPQPVSPVPTPAPTVVPAPQVPVPAPGPEPATPTTPVTTPPAPAVPPVAPPVMPTVPVETPPNVTDNEIATAEPTPTPAPAPEETPASVTDNGNDAVTIARKKIISPISDPQASTVPDLNELLARENATTPGSTPADDGQFASPHPPGHVIAPNAPADMTSSPSTNGNTVDPNSISL